MATVYIAGPMSGIPDHNAPAFDAMAEKLRAEGHTVLSPAERMREQLTEAAEAGAAWQGGDTYRVLLLADLNWIANECDQIQLLPGWKKSKGAVAEVAMAVAMRIPVYLPGATEPHTGIEVRPTW